MVHHPIERYRRLSPQPGGCILPGCVTNLNQNTNLYAEGKELLKARCGSAGDL